MILLKNITLKNFLSIGQVTQAVNFDRQDLTLILGENLDMGGDGARNGTGKTSLIQGLSYVLFGVPINSIRKDNLVNRTNGKGMLVTLEFSINGIDYKIERGRKPNVLRFYVDNNLQKAVDDAQGDSRETQQAIERALNMSSDMFKHIVAHTDYIINSILSFSAVTLTFVLIEVGLFLVVNIEFQYIGRSATFYSIFYVVFFKV